MRWLEVRLSGNRLLLQGDQGFRGKGVAVKEC